jgi:cysteine-rich repeat protein
MTIWNAFTRWCSLALGLCLAVELLALTGCADPEKPVDARPAHGTIQLALTAQGESGTVYRLRRAQVQFDGPEPRTVSLNGADEVVRVELEPGMYLATLLDGWQMQRQLSDGAFQTVHAALQTAQPQSLDVQEGEVTHLVFAFNVGDDAVTFGTGGVHVEVTVHELEVPDGGASSAECGNGVIEPGEQCDDGSNSGAYEGCAPGCVLGPRCGDGVVQPMHEVCDDGNLVSGDGCTSMCTFDMGGPGFCGDGIIDPGEVCDDGNAVDGDGCTNACALPACGDGILQPGAGEQCDHGVNNGPGQSCSTLCTIAECGDGIQQPGEDCDDANVNDNDSCKGDCTFNACGDGAVYTTETMVANPNALEQCDDGNADNTDGCTSWCELGCPVDPPDLESSPWCDPSIVSTACDYSDKICTCMECGLWSCEPTCGNGIVDAGEACDDGNLDPCDGCLPTCESFTPPAPGGGPAVAPTLVDADAVWCGDVDVNSNLVVLQDTTLFVGPGTVRFGSNVTLQVRGGIHVGGNAVAPALLTSASATPSPGDWFGIDVRRDLGASGRVEHAVIEYAQRGLSGLDQHGVLRDSVFRHNVAGLADIDGSPAHWCDSPRPRGLHIERVEFSNNDTGALPDGSSSYAIFDSCQFSNNSRGIRYGYDIDVIGSQFVNNDYGIEEHYSLGRLEDSQFLNNDVAISRLYYADVRRTLIADNTSAGVGFAYYDVSLSDNTIVRNGSGITFEIAPGAFTLTGNTLCDNGTFDLISNTLSSIIAEGNYWCTTDGATIPDRISDVFDGNPNAGPVFYEPFLTAPSPDAPADPGP